MANTIDPVTMVLVDLTEYIRPGSEQVLIRMRQEDKDTAEMARQILGLTQSEFYRVAIVQVAKKVISENARG